MPDEEQPLVRHVVIPSDQLRQLASLLSSSAQILEELISSHSQNGIRRNLEVDLEKQLGDSLGVPDGASVRSRREDADMFVTFRNSNDINAEEDRASEFWKGIMSDEHQRAVYEQLSNAYINLQPQRSLDEVLFQRLYPILLTSCYAYDAPATVSDVGPLLALLKRRRQRLAPEHLRQDGSDASPTASPIAIGIILDEYFKQSITLIPKTMGDITIGTLLDVCHQKGAMPPIFSRRTALEQVETIVNVFQLVSLKRPRDTAKPMEYYSQADLLKISVQQALDLFTQGSSVKESALPRNTSISFRSRDLNIRTIRDIGRLSIEWTDYLDRHLELDVDSMTLYVFWFGTTYFCDGPGWWNTGRGLSEDLLQLYPGLSAEAILSKLKTALGLSYSILFTSPPKGSADPTSAYKSMPVPPWVQEFYTSLQRSGSRGRYRNMGDLMREETRYPGDVHRGPTSHIGEACPVPEAQTSFSRLGPFEDRMRVLDAYMKSKKPNTLRGLWRDKRDSLQWWTLWVVIIFGGLGLFISFLSLVVSTAQTVATFRQLET